MENAPAVKNESLPFVLMDKLDDELIIQELEGRMPNVLTYHFTGKDGKELWGLSKPGVDEATSELAKQGEVIRELDLNWTDGKDEAFFTVKAGRYVISKNGQEVLLDTKIGVKRQNKKTETGKDNPFWFEQGSMKAARNASHRLIPKGIVQAVIEYAKKNQKVKEVKGNGGKDMEEFKKESEKTFAMLHDRLAEANTADALKAGWAEVNNHRKRLLPEHFQMLDAFKTERKEKLTNV